ncbi:Thioesterase superfamily member 2 [Camponotus floridanus]|uniref:Acyl-coenzyme A thioesterase 13 n=1 Tax=Camponotus floridanus TaxID=104421 RepID=E2AFE2_CAMFO|nr:acyl-coenzyme A thioesterase 13 [Camponotus floridanus]XP_011257110.1 acyl-coenzyme A thioesterase 13 [Camponotus floridanus]EFN67835.1 Thioesterase superfamily member 2 [Camponotus floridanus]
MSRTKLAFAMWEKMKNTKNFSQCMKNVQLLSAADGKCKAQFTVAEEHLNLFGTLHGGFTSTAIDVISWCALVTYEREPKSPGAAHVSVDLHITFLKAAFPGEVVTIDAETIRSGKTLAFLEVELTKNDGKDIVARGQHTKFIMTDKQ